MDNFQQAAILTRGLGIFILCFDQYFEYVQMLIELTNLSILRERR
jgi:hypothetical protein